MSDNDLLSGSEEVPLSQGEIASAQVDAIWTAYKQGNKDEIRRIIEEYFNVIDESIVESIINESSEFVQEYTDADPEKKRALVQKAEETKRQLLKLAKRAKRPLNPISTFSSDPPAMDWLVNQWMPRGRIGALFGDGGTGKSRLALQLATAIAAQGIQPWISPDEYMPGEGIDVEVDGTVVWASWEDDIGEFERRLFGIGQVVGEMLHFLDMSAHGAVWSPREGAHTQTISEITDIGREVRHFTESVNATLLVLDPIAAAYAANENTRELVRAFMTDWDSWARKTGCAVLLIGHTPKGAEGKAAGYSGSTDWHNASRFLWSLEVPPGEKDADTPIRRLRCMKSNYGRAPAKLYLDWAAQRKDTPHSGLVSTELPPESNNGSSKKSNGNGKNGGNGYVGSSAAK